MQELIKYIGDILNIKTDSVYTIQDMTEELEKVQDIVAYRSYIKDNLDKIDYKTGFQKFILLTQKYLRLEYVAMNPHKGDYAEDICRLANREIIYGRVYNNLSDADRGALMAIGDYSYIQELIDKNILYDEIVKIQMESEDTPTYKELPNRLKEMTKKIGN